MVSEADLAHRQACTAQRQADDAPALAGPAVQRTIGTVGEGAIGMSAKRSRAQAAAYSVAGARHEGGGWKYLLKHKPGLLPEQWVTQDEAYDLVQDAPLSSDEQAMNTLLAKLIREPLGGKIDTLLGGEKAALVAAGVGMGEQQASSVSIRVLWSGGAGDCVIVGAVSGGKAWITHADRTGPSPDRIVKEVGKIGKGAQVFLASQIFRSPNAGSSQLVRSIVGALQEQEATNITAVFAATSLAMNADTGAVLAGLSQQDIEKLKSGSAWEDLSGK